MRRFLNEMTIEKKKVKTEINQSINQSINSHGIQDSFKGKFRVSEIGFCNCMLFMHVNGEEAWAAWLSTLRHCR